ncbi:hypothetical protein BJX65DRAFT_237126 [Aspergillus insuetus]
MNANQPSNKVQHNCHRSPVPEARDPDKQSSTQQEMNRSPKIGSSTKRVSGQQTGQRQVSAMMKDKKRLKMMIPLYARVCLDCCSLHEENLFVSARLQLRPSCTPFFLSPSASFFMCDGIGSFIQKSPVTLPSQAQFAHLVRDHFPRSFSLCLPSFSVAVNGRSIRFAHCPAEPELNRWLLDHWWSPLRAPDPIVGYLLVAGI